MGGAKQFQVLLFRAIKNINFILIFNLLSFVLLLVLGFYYLSQINNLTVSGYNIRDYEKQISQLENEIHDLDLKIAQKQSIYKLKEKVDNIETLANLDSNEIVYLQNQYMAKK